MTDKQKAYVEDMPPPQTWRAIEIVKSLPQRLMLLLWKLVSWKGAFLAGYFFLTMTNRIPSEMVVWGYLVLFVLIVFDKKGLDVIKDLRR